MKKNIFLFVIVALVAACVPSNATQSPVEQITTTPEPISTLIPTLTPVPQDLLSLLCIAFPDSDGCPTPTSAPPVVYELPQDYMETFSGSDWEQNPVLPPGFMTGHTFMDFYSTDYQVYFDTTVASMQESGVGWASFINFWSYSSLEPPVIVPFSDIPDPDFRTASGEEICHMVETAHAHDLQFVLMMGLNFDIARGEWQGWEYAQQFGDDTSRLLNEKSENITANSEWWDAWFETYQAYALDQAGVAQQCDADMFVIGYVLDGAVRTGLADRWRALISNVRDIYSGPLSYVSANDENYSQAEDFPYDALDYIIINLYNKVSMAESPTLPDLVASFERFNDTQFEPLSQRYNKPVIFLPPFQSRDHGAQQVWFEPGTTSPDVGEDLLIQAMLYEALFQAVQDEPWVAGIWTWGYWWRDDFDTQFSPGDASYNKSSTVRNKPAMWIIEKWSDSIAPAT